MRQTVSVSIPHRLTRAEARRRLEDGFQRVTERMVGNTVHLDQAWSGDHLDFKAAMMGQAISGRLDVKDETVDLELDLPFLLAAMANVFKGRLKKETTLLLEKK